MPLSSDYGGPTSDTSMAYKGLIVFSVAYKEIRYDCVALFVFPSENSKRLKYMIWTVAKAVDYNNILI